MAFRVFVDDNFHPYDESERYPHGEFDTLDEAITACRSLVDGDLAHQYEPGMTADELFGRYTSFGEDPWITSTEQPSRRGEVLFSAWTYAEQRAAQICSG